GITGLVNGETATVTATGSQTEVGSSTNTYSIDWGTTDSNNYAITETLGTLTVTPAPPSPVVYRDVSGSKIWVGGPEDDRPAIEFELWRKGGTAGDGEKVVNATLLIDDAVDFGKQVKYDKKGVEYKYYVVEPEVPEDYKASYDGLTATNTYIGPEVEGPLDAISAQKIWVDSRNIHPTIWFKLYRHIEGGSLEEVPNAEIKELKSGNTKVRWAITDLKDAKGNKYIFSVKEVDEFGRDFVPAGYEKLEAGLTVTNRERHMLPLEPVTPAPTFILFTPPKLNKEDHIPYVIGYPDGSFRPEGNITRAEMTAIFSRLLKEKIFLNEDYPLPFSDVERSAWYAEYIGHLTHVGVIEGYPDGTFKPENQVTRAEFATVASRFIKNKKSIGGFRDVSNEYWAKESIENVKAEGWIQGYPDGSFRPERYITRAEVVSIVNKMLDRNADKAFVDNHVRELANYTDLSREHWAYYPIMEASHGHDYARLPDKAERWKNYWIPSRKDRSK
ncbi:MAG: Cna B-type domain-containing protein, partial [Clostridiales bacterium]|nr:Cna B-type domain-containing protein [Clostridiales bacterium]